MYHILPETKGRIIAIHVEEYMTSQNYKTILPYIKSRIEQQGTICILVELKNFKGIEFLGILKCIPYIIKYGRHIEKKAIITDENWVYSWVNFFSFFSKTNVRCFNSTQTEKAWMWVKK